MLPIIPVMPMEAAFQPATLARRHWPGCGEQARFLDSLHPALRQHRRSLQHRRPLQHRRRPQLPALHRPAAMMATGAITAQPRPLHQLPLPRLHPPRLPRHYPPAIAAHLLRVVSQTWTCRTGTSVRSRFLRAIRETLVIRRFINPRHPTLWRMRTRRSWTILPPARRLAQITSRWRQQAWPPRTALRTNLRLW